MEGRLRRALGLGDAVVIGLGAMLGAGIFAALEPATAAAAAQLPIAIGIAGMVAFANASSSAQLAARHPEAGGTSVYGRERLGPFWGWLAGWAFVAGKTASLAAMAITFAAYAAPAARTGVAVAAVVVMTGVTAAGVEKTARLTYAIVASVIAVLAAIVADAGLGPARATTGPAFVGHESALLGILQAAGIMFFAFAGYARIATLGEEVRDPARTIPRAIVTAFGITIALYVLVAVAALHAVGPAAIARGSDGAPLELAVGAGLRPWVRAGGAIASLGVLLSLLAGAGRTMFALARDGWLPRALAHVHPRFGSPARAQLVVGAAVTLLAVTTDLRTSIGFSAFTVLGYYAITNASALRLGRDERRFPRAFAWFGIAGCVTLGLTLPAGSIVSGAAVLAAGAAWFALRRWVSRG